MAVGAAACTALLASKSVEPTRMGDGYWVALQMSESPKVDFRKAGAKPNKVPRLSYDVQRNCRGCAK